MKKLLLVMVLILCPILAHGATIGMVPGDSWSTKLAQLQPGDTLQLADGTYPPVLFTCGTSGIQQGNASNPITITAAHERQARIYTDGTQTAMYVLGCQYWNFVGLMFQSADHVGTDDTKGSLLIFDNSTVSSHHVNIKHNLFYHTNLLATGYGGDVGYGLLLQGGQHDFLIEENEFYDCPANRALLISSAAGGNGPMTVRRNYLRNRQTGTSTGPNENAHNNICFYFAPGIMENNIGETSGYGCYGGDIRYLGNISLHPGTGASGSLSLSMSAHPAEYGDVPTNTGGTNNVNVRTLLGVRSESAAQMYVKHHTSIGARNAGGPTNFADNAFAAGIGNGCGTPNYNSPCTRNINPNVTWQDSLIINGAGSGLDNYDTQTFSNLTIDHMNVWNNAGGDYGAGTGGRTNSQSTNPQMGSCMAWIPDGSPMKHAASDGGDIGATVLYAYEDGVLTNKPLWRADGSWIGCGAIVAGVNDNPAFACSGVGTRLNINQNGCSFPSGYTPAGARLPLRRS